MFMTPRVRFARLHGVAAQQPRRVLVLAELGEPERRLAVVVPRRAWVFGSGATGCEEAQPIAVAAARRRSRHNGAFELINDVLVMTFKGT